MAKNWAREKETCQVTYSFPTTIPVITLGGVISAEKDVNLGEGEKNKGWRKKLWTFSERLAQGNFFNVKSYAYGAIQYVRELKYVDNRYIYLEIPVEKSLFLFWT